MVSPSSLARRVRAEQSGFTLVELLVVTAMLGFVLTAVLALAETSGKLAPQDQERAHVIREAQVGLYQITRELRQAHSVNATNAYSVDFNVLRAGSERRVVIDCGQAHPTEPSWRRCLRWEVGGDGSLSAQQVVVDRVLNTQAGGGPAVFTYTLKNVKPVYVTARVEVPAKGDLSSGHAHRVVLDDGVYIRNLDD